MPITMSRKEVKQYSTRQWGASRDITQRKDQTLNLDCCSHGDGAWGIWLYIALSFLITYTSSSLQAEALWLYRQQKLQQHHIRARNVCHEPKELFLNAVSSGLRSTWRWWIWTSRRQEQDAPVTQSEGITAIVRRKNGSEDRHHRCSSYNYLTLFETLCRREQI